MTPAINAIKMSQLENDLIDVEKEIKKYERLLNNPLARHRPNNTYKAVKKEVIRLIDQKNYIKNKIVEITLLGV